MELRKRENEKICDEDLLMMYKTTHDKRYLDILYIQVYPFIKYICKHYFTNYCRLYNVEMEEIVSLAGFTFLKAIDRFDFNKGVKFSSYLGKSICLDISDKLDYYNRKNREMYLDNITVRESSYGVKTLLSEVLPDTSIQFVEDIEEESYNAYLKDVIEEAFKTLDAKEKNLIKLYYLQKESQGKIAELYNEKYWFIHRDIVNAREKFKQNLRAFNDLPTFVYDLRKNEEKYSTRNIPQDYKDYLCNLSEREKNIVLLHYDKKLKYKEIEELTSISKRGICQIIKRSVNKILLTRAGNKVPANKNDIKKRKLPSDFEKYMHLLNDRDKKVIILRYIDKVTYSKIAEIMQTKPSNVGNLVRTATNKLISIIYRNKGAFNS